MFHQLARSNNGGDTFSLLILKCNLLQPRFLFKSEYTTSCPKLPPTAGNKQPATMRGMEGSEAKYLLPTQSAQTLKHLLWRQYDMPHLDFLSFVATVELSLAPTFLQRNTVHLGKV